MHKNTISSMRVLIPRPSSLKQHLDAELQLSFTTQVGRQLRPRYWSIHSAKRCRSHSLLSILKPTVQTIRPNLSKAQRYRYSCGYGCLFTQEITVQESLLM
ncbi:hypothetical protein M3J09_008222 [Ascochyta lentis]